MRFQSMFHMSNDSRLFRRRKQLESDGYRLQGRQKQTRTTPGECASSGCSTCPTTPASSEPGGIFEEAGFGLAGNIFVKGDERYLPLYEAKLFHQYDHRFATFDGVSETQTLRGQARDVSAAEKQDANAAVLPRYWIAESEVVNRIGQTCLSPDEATARRRQRANQFSQHSNSWRATRFQENRQRDRRAHHDIDNDTILRAERFGNLDYTWMIVFRQITNSTNERTGILSVMPQFGLGHSGAILSLE